MSFSDSVRSVFLYFFLGREHQNKDTFNYYKYPQTTYQTLSSDALPERTASFLRVVVVSDTHNRHDRLGSIPPCDLFVHCGDILMIGGKFTLKFQGEKLKEFDTWLASVPATQRVVIGGNHDHLLTTMSLAERKRAFKNASYLENEGFVAKNIRFWASPISYGRSPNKAFQSADFQAATFQAAPRDVDVLITHGHYPSLTERIEHKLHLCGHNHNSYGIDIKSSLNPDPAAETTSTAVASQVSICAPICDGKYRLNQLPVVIDIPIPEVDIPTRRTSETAESSQLPQNAVQISTTVPTPANDSQVTFLVKVKSSRIWWPRFFSFETLGAVKRNHVAPENWTPHPVSRLLLIDITVVHGKFPSV